MCEAKNMTFSQPYSIDLSKDQAHEKKSQAKIRASAGLEFPKAVSITEAPKFKRAPLRSVPEGKSHCLRGPIDSETILACHDSRLC
jgi:hypothetical protein